MTAMVGKTCTANDAEKKAGTNLNVNRGADSGGSSCLFLGSFLFTDNKSYVQYDLFGCKPNKPNV